MTLESVEALTTDLFVRRVPLLLIALVLAISSGPVGAMVIAILVRRNASAAPLHARVSKAPRTAQRAQAEHVRSPWLWGGSRMQQRSGG
jgi:hypothetical protein